MHRTLLDQLEQISGSNVYNDTKSMVNAENKEVNRLEDDLNYIRTQLRLVTGETDWHAAPGNTIVSLEGDVNTLQTFSTAAKTFTGMNNDSDSTPDYPSSNIVTQNGSLELAIGELDNVLNAVSSSTVAQDLDSVCDVGNTTDQNIYLNSLYASGSITVNVDGDSASEDAVLNFCGTNSEVLKWDNANSRFDFSDDLNVTGDITLTGALDGVDLSTWNTAIKAFAGQTDDNDNSPTYSSTNYVSNGDNLETAIGKLDTGIADVDVEKEIERITSVITSGSIHTLPNGKSYTPAVGANMDLYFNGQFLAPNSGNVSRDYQEVSPTQVAFTFKMKPNSHLIYIIRK